MAISNGRRGTDDLLNEWSEVTDRATPGPWERGYWYHVQSEALCRCLQAHGPLVGRHHDPTHGSMHVHRRPEPVWEDGVNARNDDIGGIEILGPVARAEDEAFVALARTAMPRLIAAVRGAASNDTTRDTVRRALNGEAIELPETDRARETVTEPETDADPDDFTPDDLVVRAAYVAHARVIENRHRELHGLKPRPDGHYLAEFDQWLHQTRATAYHQGLYDGRREKGQQ